MKKKQINNEKKQREILEYAEKSLDFEAKRENSIFKQCNMNLAVTSILITMTTGLIFKLIEFLNFISTIIIIFGFILITILLTALFFLLKAQWRYKQKYTKTGAEFRNYIDSGSGFKVYEDFFEQKLDDFTVIQESLINNNNKRVRDIIVSSILLYCFLLLIFVFAIVTLIIL